MGSTEDTPLNMVPGLESHHETLARFGFLTVREILKWGRFWPLVQDDETYTQETHEAVMLVIENHQQHLTEALDGQL